MDEPASSERGSLETLALAGLGAFVLGADRADQLADELARRLGNPRAVRAVGLANGSNPISIIIPCHRVIGSNGSLVGYGGGLPIKQALLSLERGQSRLL